MSNIPKSQTKPQSQASGRIEHFKFDLGDKVIISEVQRPGTIESLLIDFLGPQYRVAYWDNSKRETVWLKADELFHINPSFDL